MRVKTVILRQNVNANEDLLRRRQCQKVCWTVVVERKYSVRGNLQEVLWPFTGRPVIMHFMSSSVYLCQHKELGVTAVP